MNYISQVDHLQCDGASPVIVIPPTCQTLSRTEVEHLDFSSHKEYIMNWSCQNMLECYDPFLEILHAVMDSSKSSLFKSDQIPLWACLDSPGQEAKKESLYSF